MVRPDEAGVRAQRPRRALVALLVAAAVALSLHAPIASLTDPDSLYHIRHAWIYRTGGLFQGAFPWIQFSAIEREASNLWYGFHILLVPFTLMGDLVLGIRVAGVLVTVACLMLVWAALARLRARWPILWMLVFAFATADSLYRLTMVRPHPLSLGIAVLLFALLCEARPSRWGLLALAALFAWIHLALAWLPLLTFGVVQGAGFLRRRKPDWGGGAFLAGGLVLGAMARPNPIGGIRLAGIQVVTWIAQKGATVPLDVGRELKPFEGRHFVDQLVPATLMAASAAVLVLARRPKRAKLPRGDSSDDRREIAAWSSLVLTALFLALGFTVARRANDLFVASAVVLAACAADAWIPARGESLSLARAACLAPLALGVIAAPFRSIPRFRTYLQAAASVGPERMRASGTWLRDHARPGEIVFNVNWDTFAHLFYWSPRTYCVSGNDPIFLYARDPELYWICRELESDAFRVVEGRAMVCPAPDCPRERLEDVHAAITGRFRASYVVAQKRRTPRLVALLASDPRFELVFQTESEVVFRTGR